jgi:hypothetical protein
VMPAAPTSALPTVPVAGVPDNHKPGTASSSVGIMLPKPGMATAGSTNLVPNRPITPIAIQPQPVAINSDTVSRTEFNQVNQMLQKISGVLERIAPGSSSRIPGFGNRSAVAPKVAAAAPVARPSVAAPAANLPQRTMTSYGVVPNGNSFVMFDTSGVTQRVTLGESVGSTGWTLIDVTQSGLATFRRNGEIRNVAQGEKL